MIKPYEKNGKTFYKVYVSVSSKRNKGKRIQRLSYKCDNLELAQQTELRLIEEASYEISKYDQCGLQWYEVLHEWTKELRAGNQYMVSERRGEEYLSIIYKWTDPWMYKQANQLSRADGRELLNRLERAGLTKAYQKRVKNIISSIFDWAIEFRFIQGVLISPLKGLIVEKKEESPPEILTLEEIKRFLNAAKVIQHRWYPAWAFAILTGMRSGELFALTWDQIDLEKETIMVDRSYDSNSKETGPTKGRYWRTVPINSSLKKLIIELKSSGHHPSYVLPRQSDWENGDQAVSLKNFLRSIQMKPVRFHTLRACFATQMLASGVPAPVVMKIGGWKKSATMDIYLRLAGVETKGATQCLEFVPDEIEFTDNVINLFKAKGETV